MGKPTGKDESTQPLSASQIMPMAPKLPGGHIPKNDRSVWKNVVVGADDFATGRPKPRSRTWLILLLAGLGAGTALGLFYALSSSEPAKPAATSPLVHDAGTAAADAALDAPADAPLDAPADAALDAPADAAVDAAPVDAGVPKPPPKKPGKKKQPVKPKKKLH